MRTDHCTYIWQTPDWPAWRHDHDALTHALSATSNAFQRLSSRLARANPSSLLEAQLSAAVLEVTATSAIEGEHFDSRSVRSSVAYRLGVDIGALAPVDRHVEGVVEMVLDSTANARTKVTKERLFGWHAALFPTGYSGMTRITIGAWRDDSDGPMQVVSGAIGRQRVHFEAPPAKRVAAEMRCFLSWVDRDDGTPPLIKAGLGHLWLVTVHPFDDGNGRVARAIGDLLLARACGSTQCVYSLSAQIQRDRKAYYEILEKSQKGTMDVTAWLLWFLATLQRALDAACHTTHPGGSVTL